MEGSLVRHEFPRVALGFQRNSSIFYGDRSVNGICNEALGVRQVMEPFESLARWAGLLRKRNFRTKDDPCDGEFSVLVLFEITQRRVGIRIHHESLARGNREECEHVAAG